MVSLLALDLILRRILARVMDISFVVHVFRVHLDDAAGDPPGFRVPAHVVMELESFRRYSLRGFEHGRTLRANEETRPAVPGGIANRRSRQRRLAMIPFSDTHQAWRNE